ncbi:hydrogenase maturation protease [Frankia sp. AiPs1]|uniref:hydrogenase maturation protease n=1 Tax=Frankia sp. AiPa1 TaxID=573492 RepID=UPI00202B4936|nr:hydrogenase maturation protease [Frankia sp. AiPa1]MCL9762247.1 hydrogenase maturation protease [Frankia sp. AiPa1]
MTARNPLPRGSAEPLRVPLDPPGFAPPSFDAVVIGCGNPLRGDDGAGPLLVRQLAQTGVPAGVRLVDGGTAGLDTAFAMRGARRVLIVDAARTGAAPGTVVRVPADRLAALSDQPPSLPQPHAVRWDQALAFARWLLGDDFPTDIVVYLVEAACLDLGADLTPAVRRSLERVHTMILDDLILDGPAAAEQPQPVGVFPLPAGYLLIPGRDDETAALRHTLAAGRTPSAWPARLRALELAYRGEIAAAADLLDGDDSVDRYNRFVLRPAGPPVEDPADLRAALGPRLGVLVDVVRFSCGALAEPPELSTETGEVAALVHAAHAAAAMAGAAPEQAAGHLARALEAATPVAPGLAAQLLSTAADLRHGLEGPTDAVLADLAAAGAALDKTDLVVARAELRLALGSAYQERAGDDPEQLRAAVEQYLAALRLVTVDSAPELFAAAQVNLATAYLAMPMTQASDQLRVGVAIGGLRTALTVYTPQTHPQRWANAQLNLANALVYAPSAHRRENLVEAAGRFAQVVAARDPRTDPIGRARALAGQGNALAHLGAVEQATNTLSEAQASFERAGSDDEARVVRALLDELALMVAEIRASRP